jgi:hypothetical protein
VLEGQSDGKKVMWSTKITAFLFQDTPKFALSLCLASAHLTMYDQEAFAIALEEAKIGYKEGGVPVSTPETSIILKFREPFRC